VQRGGGGVVQGIFDVNELALGWPTYENCQGAQQRQWVAAQWWWWCKEVLAT